MANIIVFGASGKTGRIVCEKAVAQGHSVKAFVRSHRHKFERNIKSVVGDVLNDEDVKRALDNVEVVLVCLGPTGLKDRTTLTEGARNIALAMSARGVERVVFISAVGVNESWQYTPISSKFAFRTFLKTVLKQHEIEEQIFAESELKWTAVRAAVLNDKEASGSVIASNSEPTKKISREDLANFMVSQIGDAQYIRQAISVTGGRESAYNLTGQKWNDEH